MNQSRAIFALQSTLTIQELLNCGLSTKALLSVEVGTGPCRPFALQSTLTIQELLNCGLSTKALLSVEVGTGPCRPWAGTAWHETGRAWHVASFSALLLAVLAFLLLSLPLPSPCPRPQPHPPPRHPLRLLPPPLLSFRDLRSATASFDPSRSLDCGASAVIFRGVLPDGKSVAVKRLDHPSSSAPSSSPPQTFSNREFHNELHVLTALPPSPFIVSLLGYCLDSPHRRLLVYEYMPNSSLQDALFSSSNHHLVLSWDSRFGIVLDVAQALAFLSWDRQLGSGLGARLARQATQTGTMRGRTRRRTASIPRNLSQVERLDSGEDALFQELGLDASVGKPKKK